MSIGERIVELRNSQNMSQADLAKALDVSRQAVSKWENDITAPDSLNMIRLADYLETDIEYLTTGRRNYGRRPPVVIHEVETKVVEKPVTIEKIVEVEKVVDRIIEKPILKKITRTKLVRNPVEYVIVGIACFVLGILIGIAL